MLMSRGYCKACKVSYFSAEFKRGGEHYCCNCGVPLVIDSSNQWHVIDHDSFCEWRRYETRMSRKVMVASS